MIITNFKQVCHDTRKNTDELKQFMLELLDSWATHSGTEPVKAASLLHKPKKTDKDQTEFYNLPDGLKEAPNFLLDMGAELRPIFPDDIIVKPDPQIRSYRHVFTEEEHKDNAASMAKAHIKMGTLKDDQKALDAEFKSRIKEAEANLNRYSHFVQNGYKTVEAECEVILDYEKREKKFRDISTGKIVDTVPMSEDDQQILMNLWGNA